MITDGKLGARWFHPIVFIAIKYDLIYMENQAKRNSFTKDDYYI